MAMTWKMKGRLYGLLIVTLSFVNANANPSIHSARAAGNDPVIDYENDHADMAQAQETAQLHLSDFMDRFIGTDGLAPETAAVKVAIPVNETDHEVIWISPFGRSDGGYVGRLANAPAYLEGMSHGDVVTFDEAQIRDWYFIGQDGLMYGSFTTRVMLADMAPATAAQITAILSPTALPADW